MEINQENKTFHDLFGVVCSATEANFKRSEKIRSTKYFWNRYFLYLLLVHSKVLRKLMNNYLFNVKCKIWLPWEWQNSTKTKITTTWKGQTVFILLSTKNTLSMFESQKSKYKIVTSKLFILVSKQDNTYCISFYSNDLDKLVKQKRFNKM